MLATHPAPSKHTILTPPPRSSWRNALHSVNWIILALALPVFVHVVVLRETTIDDAFIQFRYGELLAANGTWGMIADRISNTSTSPLNTILYGLAAVLPGPLEDAVPFLTTLELLVLLVFLLKISFRLFDSPVFGLLAFVGVALNPLLISTFGLEGTLFFAMFAGCFWFFLSQKPVALGISLGLLALARPDGALLALLFLSSRFDGKRSLVVAYFITLVPWFVFSWIHLGSILPDTLIIKTGQASWGGYAFFNGLILYVKLYPLATIGSFALAPFALIALRTGSPASRRLGKLLLIYAGLHFLAYTLLVVPPYHWYYLHTVSR